MNIKILVFFPKAYILDDGIDAILLRGNHWVGICDRIVAYVELLLQGRKPRRHLLVCNA